ncbi:MAG: bifunctional hydroxymethylpyrimidine kinase/phosphomethylpyrimidine kinase [Eggerthellaceae bacterium]
MPSVLSIAGSDSSGGAGIQADIKTIQAFGLFAQTAITALTAQNTTGVFGIQDVDPDFVRRQVDVVFDDIRPQAVKVGMVSSSGIAEAIAHSLAENDARNVVVDPVMVSTSGSSLMADETVRTLVDSLFPLADLLTPNIPEAEALCGMRIEGEADMLRAAKAVHGMMRPDAWVLVKGGHSKDNADDLLYGPDGATWIRGKRIATENSHGTGCSLSSAIACGLARGLGMECSVRHAKAYLSGALQHDSKLGKGNGPLDHMWRYRPLFPCETADRIC